MCKIHYYIKCYFPDCEGDVGKADGMLAQCETALSKTSGRKRCEPQTVSTEPFPRKFSGYICHKCYATFPNDDNDPPREWIAARSKAEKKALDDAIANMNKAVAESHDKKNAATQT